MYLAGFWAEFNSFQDVSKRLLKLLNDDCKFDLFIFSESDVSQNPNVGQVFNFSSHLWCFKV